MNNVKITKIIASIIAGIGIVVIIGWIYDISVLKSILPNQVTMKFSTAFCFVFSGILLYFIAERSYGKIGYGQIAIPISGLVIFLFVATLLTTNFLGLVSGIEQLYVKDGLDEVKTKIPGVPSIPTLTNFLLIVIVGIISLSDSNRTKPISYIGYTIMITGIVSIVGYNINQPIMYYYAEKFSSGMAIHTSILFALIGFALTRLKFPREITYTSIKIQTKLVSLFLTSSIIPVIFILVLNNTLNNNSAIDHSDTILIIGIVTAISVSIFSVFTGKSISKPIVALNHISKKISAGDFSVKASENSNDEIGVLAKSFNRMIDDVIKAERLSTIGLLASRLGHDLRNNLSVIFNSTELMKTKFGTNIDDDLQRRIDTIQRSAQSMNIQIGDILNFVRSTPLTTEYISLAKILQNSINTIPVPPKIRIIMPENDIHINCNQNQFEVVLTNLINNSIQAIEAEGEITVTAKEDDDNSIIEIRDSGIGIPTDIIANIFEPLFTTKQKGTGLGLVTCKNIIEQRGGSISVKNNPTTFTVKLPK